jgi:glutathione S-transferase
VYRLYDSKLSGNAWKLRILMRELGIPFERVSLDLAKGEAKSPEFAKVSRFQRVPVLELDDGRHLIESGAIMLFLAKGTDLLPADPVERAEVTSWLFFEQADLVKPLALPRFFKLRGIYDQNQAKVAEMQETGYVALGRLEAWINGREWLANGRFSLADLAVFPYVALAHEGGYEMNRFPGIQRWLKRLSQRPSWQPLVPEAA